MKLAFMCTLLFLFGTQAPIHLCFASNYPPVNYGRVLHQFIAPSPLHVHAATVRLTMQGFCPTRRPLTIWSKHGTTCFAIPGHDPPLDITVFMDISENPGPTLESTRCHSMHSRIFTDGVILNLQNNHALSPFIIQRVKYLGILKLRRGCKAGCRKWIRKSSHNILQS